MSSSGTEPAAPPQSETRSPSVSEEAVLVQLGERIRDYRREQGKTLEALAAQSGLSASMLSLVERGKTSPSLGSLVSICSALDVRMETLFGAAEDGDGDLVIRDGDHPVFQTAEGVVRKVIRTDRARKIEIAVNTFDPLVASDTKLRPHSGFEYALLLEGDLTVQLESAEFDLSPGDSIGYASTRPHRIVNPSPDESAIAIWVNLYE